MPLLRGLVILSLLLLPVRVGAATLHHDLVVTLDPELSAIEVTDTITLPAGGPQSREFTLHAGLQAELSDTDAKLVRLPAPAAGAHDEEPAVDEPADRVELDDRARLGGGDDAAPAASVGLDGPAVRGGERLRVGLRIDRADELRRIREGGVVRSDLDQG